MTRFLFNLEDKMKKKIFCLWMCVAMVVTLMPSMAFAESTTKNGSIAKVTWDEDNNEQYDTGNITLQVGPGSELQYCLVGTGTGASFEPMSDVPESWSISVKRDGWTEAVTKDNPSEEDPLYEGAFWGWYDIDEKAPQLGYNQNAILLGADAYGDYQITMNWVIDGVTYTASTTLTLEKKAQLAKGWFWSLNNTYYESQQGFLKSWSTMSTMTTDENNKFQIDYEPYYSYRDKCTMLYADGENGILNYVESNCGIDGLFTVGDAVEYKSGLSVIPLEVDYSKITADMVGDSYTLTFKTASGEEKTCSVIITKKNELSGLENGRVYAIEDGIVKKDGKLYIDNQDEDLDSLVRAQFSDKIKRTTKISSTHFAIWNASDGTFTPVEISCSDSAITISGSKEDGYEFYANSVTSGNFTAGEKTISYNFYLPESGFYRNATRNSANYLSDEVYLAEETAVDGKYTFYYLAKAAEGLQKSDLSVEYSDDLSGVDIEETNNLTDSTDNQTYYAWKIVVDSSFSGDDEEFYIYIEGEKNRVYYSHYDFIDIHDAEKVPESQQLYWFDESDVEVNGEGYLQVREGDDSNIKRYAKAGANWTNKELKVYRYFAIKIGENYKAVDSVLADETEGISIKKSSDDNKYLYVVEWTGFGKYHFATEVNGKGYRFNLNVKLPGTGFYLTSTRSEDSYLENEFHYINATEKNGEGTEAYFYLIAPAYEYTADEISVSCVKYEKDDDTELYEWKEKNVNGISIGKPTVENLGGTSYFLSEIAVNESYRSDDYMNFQIEYENDEDSWCTYESIRIYDSTEISESKQLYAFDCDEVEVDNDQKLQLKDEQDVQDYTLDNIAGKGSNFSSRAGTITRCFAVKENGNYYAVDSLTASGEGISIAKSEDYEYGYTIEWSDFGEYRLVGTYKENEYYFNLTAELPNAGFYSSTSRNEDGYLDGTFHYINATDRSENGTEAYFYLIARIYGYSLEEIQISIGDSNWDEEQGKSVWSEEQIEGLSIGTPEIKTFDGEKYVVWKVTIGEIYRSTDYYRYFRISYGDNDYSWSNTESIRIYDSTEIPEDEQLYFFEAYDVTLGEDGKFEPKEDGNELQNLAQKKLRGYGATYYDTGYFAVKQGENYYSVTTVSSPESVKITEKKGEYTLSIAKIGEYEITAEYQGKTYKMRANFSLPSHGFFAKEERTAENYLYDYFSVKDAVEKSKDGKESYCYLYWFYSSYDEGNEEIHLESFDNGRDSADTAGLKIEKVKEIVEENGQTYYVFKITVPATYTAINGNEETWKVTDGNMIMSLKIKSFGLGDIDRNGKIDFVDALYLRRHVAGWSGYTLADTSVANVHIDEEDNKIDDADVIALERYVAGWKDYKTLPVA